MTGSLHEHALINSVSIASGFLTVNFLKKKWIHNPQIAIKKATEPTYELNGCENNLTQCGVDTLGLLLLYEIDPELTRATHILEIQSKTTFTLSIYWKQV